MNILPVNNIKNFSVNNIWTQTNNKNQRYGLRMQRPLTTDVVSFRESPKTLISRSSDISRGVAKDIYKITSARQWKVTEFLNNTFGDLEVTKYSPGNIIYKILDRAKTPDSLREKAMTNGMNTKDMILNKMTDLNGGKLVLRDGSREGVAIVLDRLAEAIERGQVILKEIENKRPTVAKSLRGAAATQYDYELPEKLEAICEMSNKIHPSEKVNFIHVDYTESNYPALHFLMRLPGENWLFEVQIMGYDVALYKDLDDILWKLLNNKNVDKKFKKIADIIKPLNEPGNVKLKEQFNKYRSNVFLFQRSKAPHIRKTDKYVERFLPISDEIEDGEMRELLDMNNLYSIYLDCINKQPKEKVVKK